MSNDTSKESLNLDAAFASVNSESTPQQKSTTSMEKQKWGHTSKPSRYVIGTTGAEQITITTPPGTHIGRVSKSDTDQRKSFSSGPKIKLEADMVNSPPHYLREGDMECIDAMVQVFGEEAVRLYSRINAFKYQWRQNYKHDDPSEDISKAIWYLRFSLGEDPRNDK